MDRRRASQGADRQDRQARDRAARRGAVMIAEHQRAVLRALADQLVPAVARTADPSGFWAASGSALGADAGVAQALAALPPEQLHGVLALLDGLHVLGFATASPRSRQQLLHNVSLMGAAPATG